MFKLMNCEARQIAGGSDFGTERSESQIGGSSPATRSGRIAGVDLKFINTWLRRIRRLDGEADKLSPHRGKPLDIDAGIYRRTELVCRRSFLHIGQRFVGLFQSAKLTLHLPEPFLERGNLALSPYFRECPHRSRAVLHTGKDGLQ